MTRVPIRVRLTLAFALAMAVVLAALGAFVYVRVGNTLISSVDQTLRAQAREASTRTGGERGLVDTDAAGGTTLAQVFDAQGAVVRTSSPGIVRLLSPADARRAAAGTTVFRTVTLADPGGEWRVLAVRAAGNRRAVAVARSLQPRAETLHRLSRELLIALPLGLLLASLAGYLLAAAALRPVEAMRRRAASITAASPDVLPVPPARDEISRLAETLNDMLARLHAAFEHERRFVADASHELRTPLTIIELKASRLLERNDLTERQRADLTVIQQERQHMTHLVDDLLFLARADAGHAQARHENVHLDELIVEVVERFAPLAQERCLRVEVGDLPDLTVFGDRIYLLRMLGNLVENALKYSGPDGTCVRLDLAPCERAGAQWARLTVSDDGPGIPANHLPHVFERFYRADVSRTHSDTASTETGARAGSGLGLAIARWIAQAHDGDITLDSDSDKGTVCTVMLPLECGEA